MTRLVDRFGRTGFAALSSLIWALPMAAWAGSADLSPIDKTIYPWIALAIGLVMLVVWLVLLSRLGKIPVSSRERRFDIGQMSRSERLWILATAAFGTGLIAWLNAAATVDWAPLSAAVGSGKSGPTLFAAGLAIFLLLMVVGIWLSWRKAGAAYRTRTSH
jgi:membrane protease YdiL (CAAX protease family)